MLVLSGQVKRETCMAAHDLTGLRQLGDQEVGHRSAWPAGITKYAALVLDPTVHSLPPGAGVLPGRPRAPGPCWLDIPVDVQGARIDPAALPAYDQAKTRSAGTRRRSCEASAGRSWTGSAARPGRSILAGSGVRLAGALEEFHQVIRLLRHPGDYRLDPRPDRQRRRALLRPARAPSATAPEISPCRTPTPCWCSGSRLNIRQVSYNWSRLRAPPSRFRWMSTRRNWHKPTVKPDLAVHCDLKVFLTEMLPPVACGWLHPRRHAAWLAWCRERVAALPRRAAQAPPGGPPVNPYHFIETLFDRLADDDVVACGNATACIVTFQAARSGKASACSPIPVRRPWAMIFPPRSVQPWRVAAGASFAWRATAASR